ncbi:hypothetical protein AB0K35_12370 [Micromonospora sp. NPDC053740]|uniref:hypothetical protein n=1 Tax=Micromonospora sp. NPDC053740 TaxID=3155173 RepID=UPI00341B3BF8
MIIHRDNIDPGLRAQRFRGGDDRTHLARQRPGLTCVATLAALESLISCRSSLRLVGQWNTGAFAGSQEPEHLIGFRHGQRVTERVNLQLRELPAGKEEQDASKPLPFLIGKLPFYAHRSLRR